MLFFLSFFPSFLWALFIFLRSAYSFFFFIIDGFFYFSIKSKSTKIRHCFAASIFNDIEISVGRKGSKLDFLGGTFNLNIFRLFFCETRRGDYIFLHLYTSPSNSFIRSAFRCVSFGTKPSTKPKPLKRGLPFEGNKYSVGCR